ncbi:MAG: phosphoribosyltransferase [Gammaproteobacteria bacterium]|jgi:ComF family protein|nr:phosphoribosyltransferase [Gammaproteobacteria bacterium]|tara:strand:+ start:1020 stop:1715 length:696 start_codon:yes stop_codon:yes gene_type:complete
MTTWLDNFLFAVLPGTCILCDAYTRRNLDLCLACEADLPWLNHACLICSIPLPEDDAICGKCLVKRPPFTRCHSVFVYRFPVDRLILNFKEKQNLVIGKILATLLVNSLPRGFSAPDLLVPVPLHKSTLRKRGFNQSAEIARVLSDFWSIPLDTQNCSRVINTRSQKSLSLNDRVANIRGAFDISRNYQGERIAIVDDVVTSGATVAELARLIASKGAGSTEVISIARTPI